MLRGDAPVAGRRGHFRRIGFVHQFYFQNDIGDDEIYCAGVRAGKRGAMGQVAHFDCITKSIKLSHAPTIATLRSHSRSAAGSLPPVDERRADAQDSAMAREERRRGPLLNHCRGAREYDDAAAGSANSNAMARMCMCNNDGSIGQAREKRKRREMGTYIKYLYLSL